ncbi:PREDICTED: heat shock 22 kDa protein, mitochondrial-like isoform X2 [Lupinus angustifolius]|uniref:heat shock 22 kDa protein, mitochondrial-like isoform X2 n=1 Tax=Lupinus angustifolius TaxID=3871 RepID=UPI00092E9E8C|nr:PREDICTED: heat shock 22 kDa protein, mitochondrial-like isoform X2 [Lupinus angustifolius]
MATSLVLNRSLSSLLSRSLRPISSISRSFNTNAMRQFDDKTDEQRNVERSDRSLPRRRDDFFSDVFNPFSSTRSLSQVLNLMDQFVENPFLNASRGIGAGAGAGVNRGWDAKETDDALLLRVDMPGLGKEDVKVSVEQNTLIIKGVSDKESENDEENIRRYSSRIDLPEKLYKIDQIKAEMKNGVLKLIVPKMKQEEKNHVFNVRVQ